MSSTRLSTLAMCLLLGACGDDSSGDNSQEQEPSTTGDGDGDGGGTGIDAGTEPTVDAGTTPRDAGTTRPDAGATRDAGTPPRADAGTRDAGTPTRDAGATPDAPTFAQVYAILSTQCSPCHTEADNGNLDMSTRAKAFTNLVGKAAAGPSCAGMGRVRVIAGNADDSLLVHKLEGTQDCGSRMPRNRTPLPAASIDRIRAWIDAGAKNN
ncbi:MAG: hypothetical protein QM778_15595 [Myxococcales bacterium]